MSDPYKYRLVPRPSRLSSASQSQSGFPRLRRHLRPSLQLTPQLGIAVTLSEILEQEELRQIVAVLEERVDTFRLHLRELLDGRE